MKLPFYQRQMINFPNYNCRVCRPSTWQPFTVDWTASSCWLRSTRWISTCPVPQGGGPYTCVSATRPARGPSNVCSTSLISMPTHLCKGLISNPANQTLSKLNIVYILQCIFFFLWNKFAIFCNSCLHEKFNHFKAVSFVTYFIHASIL